MSDDEAAGVDAFETLMGRLDYPVFVVTVAADGGRAGCLVGFATQASIHPPRFLAGLSDKNRTFRVAQGASHLAVHAVDRDHAGLARLFGAETGDDTDKFARCRWHEGPAGMPVLDEAAGWFVGRVVDRLPLGDHVGFLLEPRAGWVAGERAPLTTFRDVKDVHPGHEP